MYKETAIEKLIDYIQTLSANEQKIIARKIGTASKPTQNTMKEFVNYTRTLPVRLPKGYKFNREEANER